MSCKMLFAYFVNLVKGTSLVPCNQSPDFSITEQRFRCLPNRGITSVLRYSCEQGQPRACCSCPNMGWNGWAIYPVSHQVRLGAPLLSIPGGQCPDGVSGQGDIATQSLVCLILKVPSGLIWHVIASGCWHFFSCVLMRAFTCVKYTLGDLVYNEVNVSPRGGDSRGLEVSDPLVMALTLAAHCELGQIVLCFSTPSVLCDGLVITLVILPEFQTKMK